MKLVFAVVLLTLAAVGGLVWYAEANDRPNYEHTIE